jgi:N-acetyl-anhydromuramyl-L-alanine amidase AmpD
VNDIDFLARFAYSTGQDPIDYATENVIRGHIDAHFDPDNFPGDVNPATAALSRRILGDLMDAGWTPPEVTK